MPSYAVMHCDLKICCIDQLLLRLRCDRVGLRGDLMKGLGRKPHLEKSNILAEIFLSSLCDKSESLKIGLWSQKSPRRGL